MLYLKNKKSSGCGCLLSLAFAFLLLFFLFFLPSFKGTQKNIQSKEEFLITYAPLAQKVAKTYGLYPSMVLGQAALESNFGKSQLSREGNNYFGIKAKKGEGLVLKTREVEGGQDVYKEESFASYWSPAASFKAYGKLLGEAPRYERVRQAKSLDEALSLLYPTGYSTDPRYGQMVKRIIDQYDLTKYDE